MGGNVLTGIYFIRVVISGACLGIEAKVGCFFCPVNEDIFETNMRFFSGLYCFNIDGSVRFIPRE